MVPAMSRVGRRALVEDEAIPNCDARNDTVNAEPQVMSFWAYPLLG